VQFPAPARTKLLGVETARGIAACLVVFYHAARHVALATGEKPFGSLTQFGHAGVDFFFVLSGFIIMHAHWTDLGRPQRAGHYVQRRFTRVFPVYWAVLAVTLAVGLVSRGVFPAASELLRDIFLLPYGTPAVGVAWTLQYEMIFYTAFLLLILHRGAGRLLFAGWIVLILAAFIMPQAVADTPLQMPSGTYCVQFFMGMLAAVALRHARFPAPGLLFAAGGAGFLAIGIMENLGYLDGYASSARFAYGIPATVLLIGLVARERQTGFRLPRAAIAVGSASYAIYLMHLLGIGITWKVLEKCGLTALLPREASFLAVSVAGILAGVIGHRLIERPLIAWSRRLFERRPRMAAASGRSTSQA